MRSQSSKHLGGARDNGSRFHGYGERARSVHIEEGNAVLVHCQAGISRSATVCIAYLIRYHHLSLVAAHGVVKAAREIICPNAGFLNQLQQWEQKHVVNLYVISSAPPIQSHIASAAPPPCQTFDQSHV